MRFLPSPRETLRKLMVIAVLVQVSRYPIRPLDPLRIIMPSASLIPDRQLTFSPELAETIGLEEAVLLQALGSHLNGAEDWTLLCPSQRCKKRCRFGLSITLRRSSRSWWHWALFISNRARTQMSSYSVRQPTSQGMRRGRRRPMPRLLLMDILTGSQAMI